MMTAGISQISRIIYLFIITIFSLSLPAYAKYSGGNGLEDDPYHITTVNDLVNLANSPPDWYSCFVLMADIDLADYYASGGDSFRIGNSWPDSFGGKFDGSGHKISNFTYIGNAELDAGFFGSLAGLKVSDPTICNLALSNVRVRGHGYVGGLVGMNWNGTIINCCVSGQIDGEGNGLYLGGLVGENKAGTISGCYADVNISSTSEYHFSPVGGLVGSNYLGGIIRDCYAAGAIITSSSNVGGLVGQNYIGGTITSCWAAAKISGTSNCGGLVGTGGEQVSASFWDIQLSGQNVSAGGTGKDTAEMMGIQIYLDVGWDFTDQDDDLADWVMPENDYPRLAWEHWKRAEIPGVTGCTWQEAANVINATGFSIANVFWVPSESTPAGCVVDQRPAAGLEGTVGVTEMYLTISYASQFGKGSGTPNDPYEVNNLPEWVLLGCHSEYWDKHFVLASDLDVLNLLVTPVGGDAQPFTGVFHGNGHVIRNLRINRPHDDYIGLIGCLTNGTIEDLGLSNIQVCGSEYVGALVGGNLGGTISSCYATGQVTGFDGVGGLVGYNTGVLSNCFAVCTVTPTQIRDLGVGGLVGESIGTISKCYAVGPIEFPSSTGWCGGLVGESGQMSGPVQDSFWDTQVSGQLRSSGGTGKTTGEMKDIMTYLGADWDFTTQDGDRAEWIMPENDYPRLAWEDSMRTEVPDANNMPLRNALDTITASGLVVGYVSGRPSKSVPIGYVVSQIPAAGAGSIAGFTEVEFVVSCGDEFGGGNGSSDDPYQIKNLFEWMLFVVHVESWNKHYVLVSDIDLEHLPLAPVGSLNQPFTGFLNGNGHVIRNAIINQPDKDNIGIFGYLSNGRIENLGLEAYVEGRGDVGALVGGSFGGTISRCSANVTVKALASNAGGLVGSNRSTISDCYAQGTVWAQESIAGGLVGLNQGKISDAYANCVVIAKTGVGGLIGSGGAADRGRPGTTTGVTSSFWDIETSGCTTSAGGTGKTTAEMQTAGTFLDAGWDFVDEAANGTEDIWWIDEGKDYPRLWWETFDL